jgi:hypothetical protein
VRSEELRREDEMIRVIIRPPIFQTERDQKIALRMLRHFRAQIPKMY